MPFIAQQSYKIDLTPHGGYVVVYVSQHDNEAREIVFKIYNQGQVFDIPANINISVQGVKSNGGYFTHNCIYSGNLVTMPIADDMADVIGKAVCVLKFTNASEEKLATAKFILNVDSDSSSEGVIIDTEAEEIFNQMLNEIRAQAASISADIAELQSMVGSPLVASTVSAMTDHNKIYVYTGSESGYTNGNWYYWNGSAWTSGGVYNSVAVNMDSTPTQGSTNTVSSGGVYDALHNTDTTLSQSGHPADAKAVGDKITDLAETIDNFEGISDDVKVALLDIVSHIALWTDGQGQDYYDALYNALYNGEVIPTPTVEYPDLKTGTILANKYFDASGNIVDDDLQYLNEKYFEIDTGETYIWVRGFNSRVVIATPQLYYGQTFAYRVCYYDADKNFIGRQISDYSDELGYVEQRYFSILPPSNAKYFRVSWGKFPVGNIYRSIPTDLYAVIIVLANLDDSTISNIADLASKFYVTRNNEDVTQEVIYGRPDISYQQSSGQNALYSLWNYNIFNINGGGSPEDADGQNPATRTRIQSQVSFLMKAGDVIHFNGVKAAVRAEKIADGTVQHTTAWITDNSDFVIGGV